MVYEKCCVGGCNTTRETHRLFRFPRNDNLRNLWMAFIVPTNPQLIVLSKEQLLNKRVCEKHFDVFQFGNEGRRLRYSYPSLLTDNEIAHGVPLTATGWDVTTEHNYRKEQNEDDFTEAVLVVRKPGSDVTIEHNYYKEQNDCSKSSVEIGSSDVGNSHEQPSCSNFSTVATVVENKGIDSNTNVVKQMMPKGSTCTKKQTGGGPANPRKENTLDSKIISLIKTSAVGLANCFDSDSVASDSLESHNIAEAQVILPEEPELCNKDLKT
ncbi:unnamed protein product [Parnassius apollo]|uniref:(apollo) hypothetical protein n=1 Tax=Parnassius apollo TaxID=110799 RepID=A0A8S3VZR1_PARAO|nr:unnamed protein product [Parnassius apollo]